MATARHLPNRDSVTSVQDDGSRYIIHPADTRGRFTVWRRMAALFLILFYGALPWITINGSPAVFLDVQHLQFHFFGLTFVAQDLWLAFFLISGLGFSLFYVTSLFGRVWCGWACPQTVFLEHIYRRIERWIEGDANRRRRLDDTPWTGEKIVKRAVKHVAFLVISLCITHILLAYFVSLPAVWGMMTHAPSEHWGVFIFILVSTGILYFNFTWFREQLCIVICPYGRLQSALIDDDSVVIGYDEIRGEPRGKAKSDGVGDCVDCYRCVQVCPTGIDIRQGLQMECIGCSNCIDACDEIMTKLDRPKGLVRYDSANGLAGRKRKIIRPRIILYSVLLLLGASVMLFSFSRLSAVSTSALRMQGAPYYVDESDVRNQYLVRIANKRSIPVHFSLQVSGEQDGLSWSGFEDGIEVGRNGEIVRPLVVTVPREKYAGQFTALLEIRDDAGDVVSHRKLEFLGPAPELLKTLK